MAGMTVDEIKEKLKTVLTQKRYAHSVNVMDTAVLLAGKYGEDCSKAALAGLLHDCARDIKIDEAIKLCSRYGIKTDEITLMQPELVHGRLGEKLAVDIYGIKDPQILKAISVHTMGCPHMDPIAKIVFIADYIEPARTFPGVEGLREEAFKSLDKAILSALDSTIKYVMVKGSLLHPDTVETRNWILKELSRNKADN